MKSAAAETARFLKRIIIAQKSAPGMTKKNETWYNPTGICILYPDEETTSEFVGGILVNAYMIPDNFNNYVLSEASQWPVFLRPILARLFGS